MGVLAKAHEFPHGWFGDLFDHLVVFFVRQCDCAGESEVAGVEIEKVGQQFLQTRQGYDVKVPQNG